MSEVTKRIEIIRGEEFRPYVADKFNNTDYFADVYCTAANCVSEITRATENFPDEDTRKSNDYDQYLNNIVAFCGERGQGKTGALLTFLKFMSEYNRNKSETDGPLNVCNECQFTTLDVIDPSMFDKDCNILQVIIARMFHDFKKKCESFNKDQESFNKQREVMDKFQKVFRFINLIIKPNKIENNNFYDDSSDALIEISDTVNLRVYMHELIEAYLDFMNLYAGRKFLVISVDDIDVNIEFAYQMSEQLRKYLIIPNVVILMALKVEQLAGAVVNHYEKEYKSESEKAKYEFIKMAERYIEKLLPNGRKIYLPEIRIDAQSDEDINIIYYKNKEDKIKYNKRDNSKDNGETYILYRSKNEKENIQQEKKGVQEAVLEYVYKCTKLAFAKPEFGVHPLVPETLRELTGLFAMLSHMKKIENDVFWNDTSENQKKIVEDNLTSFENYFINTWVPNKLNEGNADIIRDLHKTNDFEKHRFIITKIYDILYNGTYFSLKLPYEHDIKQEKPLKDHPIEKDIKGEKGKKGFDAKTSSPLLYSLGDIMDAMARLTETIYDEETTRFVYAIRIVYTITMHRLILSSYTDPDKTIQEYICICNEYKKVNSEKDQLTGKLTSASNDRNATGSSSKTDEDNQEKIQKAVADNKKRLDKLNVDFKKLPNFLKDYEPNAIFKFVGGDIFGKRIDRTLRTWGTKYKSRAEFDITWKRDNKDDKKDIPALEYASLFCTMTQWDDSSLNYNNKFTDNPIVRNAHFNISYPLVNSLDWNMSLSRINFNWNIDNNFLTNVFSDKNCQVLFSFIIINSDYLQELLQYLWLRKEGNKEESTPYIDHFHIFYSNITKYIEKIDKMKSYINSNVLKLFNDEHESELSKFVNYVWEHGLGKEKIDLKDYPTAASTRLSLKGLIIKINKLLYYINTNNTISSFQETFDKTSAKLEELLDKLNEFKSGDDIQEHRESYNFIMKELLEKINKFNGDQ